MGEMVILICLFLFVYLHYYLMRRFNGVSMMMTEWMKVPVNLDFVDLVNLDFVYSKESRFTRTFIHSVIIIIETPLN